ncbi:MAG: tRNA (adenosine(37)-N6)-threonylcarbamoyltransferase complex ATPase subunit type 1 TsaE [Defluviimonas sp.]|uniref:tRNA (adenosine(37)-N6)-threonylcarbamoyltransferase complex ATPase subunit type 1 TsaE n=1 Tax=Albidovulum sp. TaxID=1872424 RepID=UPI002A2AF51F|nr:tRNA (adenosine(37)-N6)-threonylcarbamoyltransferase complex ATPase subunit type 1 TsaE [Defluviimonas sp.]
MSTVPTPVAASPLILRLRSADETADLARRIAPRLGRGDILLLEGPIGAGKSHFARALIQFWLAAEGRHEDVPSPSFTLVQVYELRDCEIWHADLYRLQGAAQVFETGLNEAFDTAICLVEWPDRLGADRPDRALTISFAPGAADDERAVAIAAADQRWAALLAGLAGMAVDD